MRITWIVGLMIFFLCGTVISQTLEYQASFTNTSATATFNTLLRPGFMTSGAIPIVGFFIIVWQWIQAIWNALIWNYTFLIGTPWEILRYVGICLSIGIVVCIIFAIRGTGST